VRKCEQIRGQAGTAGGRLGDQPRHGCKVCAIRDSLLQNFDRAADDGEDVVEVVNNATGQLTDDLHPPGLANLRFHSFCRKRLLKHILEFPAAPPAPLRQSGIAISA